MGASNYFILPIQTNYLLSTLDKDLKNATKVAWLGAIQQYATSVQIEQAHPNIKNYYFDRFTQNNTDKRTHIWDINEEGWGNRFKQEGFQILTMFRMTIFAQNKEKLLNEIVDFLVGTNNLVVYEEIIYPNSGEIHEFGVVANGELVKVPNVSVLDKLHEKFNLSNLIEYKTLPPASCQCKIMTLRKK